MSDENINLYKLLTTGSHKEIKDKLLIEISKIAKYCTETVGEGYFGKVTIPSVGPFIGIKVGEDIVVLPTAIKESKHMGNSDVIFENVDRDLIIYSDNSLTCEAIILFIMSKLWYKSKNIHLPFLIGMGMCEYGKLIVSHLIIEKYGRDSLTELDIGKYISDPTRLSNPYRIIKSYITTVGDLIDYIIMNKNDKLMCTLPNDQIIYFPELIDNLCIFFLHTSYFLWSECKITLGDQHLSNIFIHWLSNYSNCGNRSTEKIKNIYYELKDNTYIKVKANGIIFKIGDIGCSAMAIQKNVIIMGDLANRDNLDRIKMYKKKCNIYLDPILKILSVLPIEVLIKTKIFNIISSNKELSKYYPNIGYLEKDNAVAPTELDILMNNAYSDLIMKEYVDDEENFTIFLK